MFRSFHPLAYKTNNEHLPKLFFKVIRESFYTVSWLISALTFHPQWYFKQQNGILLRPFSICVSLGCGFVVVHVYP